MSNYQLWQMEKYGNALPETECMEVDAVYSEPLLPENIVSQYVS